MISPLANSIYLTSLDQLPPSLRKIWVDHLNEQRRHLLAQAAACQRLIDQLNDNGKIASHKPESIK